MAIAARSDMLMSLTEYQQALFAVNEHRTEKLGKNTDQIAVQTPLRNAVL
jgi:hypothetical protein